MIAIWPSDFKSLASTIPPRPLPNKIKHIGLIEAIGCAKPSLAFCKTQSPSVPFGGLNIVRGAGR